MFETNAAQVSSARLAEERGEFHAKAIVKMDQVPNPYQSPAPVADASMEAKIVDAIARLRAEQSFIGAILSGAISSFVAAALWAIITVITHFQIAYMAVGVGFFVGFSVRTFGKGMTPVYGVIGATFSLIGCLAGNLLSACGFIARAEEQNVAFFDVLFMMLLNPAMAIQVLAAGFSPIDLLFYGIALYQGYQLSTREITMEEAEKMIA